MKVEFAFLATKAEPATDPELLHIKNAGITMFPVRGFPSIIESLTLVYGLRVEPHECGKPYTIGFEIWDEQQGKLPGEASREFTVPPNRADTARDNTTIGYQEFASIRIERRGEYEFRILINGELTGAAVVFIEQVVNPRLSRSPQT